MYRTYKLGKSHIKEQTEYDHLGLKNITKSSYTARTIEKVKKGRRTLNAAAGLGLKPGGLSMHACSILFWAMIIPIVTFASELWILSDEDIVIIEGFQRYAGRRIQRFHSRSPNETSYAGLGWIRIELFIYVKKLLFIRTNAMQNEGSIYKRVFVNRLLEYRENSDVCILNQYNSPSFDIIKIVDMFGLGDEMLNMLEGTRVYSKTQWKELVWARAWNLESQDWVIRTSLFHSTKILKGVMVQPGPLIWWVLSNIFPKHMILFETMAKIACRASRLKADCYKFRNDAVNRPYCDLCMTLSIEDAEHMIMHCNYLNNIRQHMHHDIQVLEQDVGRQFLTPDNNTFLVIMGRPVDDVDTDEYYDFLLITAKYVNEMYNTILRSREGVG